MKILSNWKVSKKVVIKVRAPLFKAIFRSDGRKMQKSFTLETFNRIFKDCLRVKTLAIAGYTKKLSSFA